MDLKKEIREIADYPKEGISFKDITTLFLNRDAMRYVTDSICDRFKDKGITKVVGLEARGFVFGGALANQLNAGFVPVRKRGKLPFDILQETYDLEYGSDVVEMHADALTSDDVILIHDDLLATGGTAVAALKLAQKCGVKQIFFSFICDLEFIETPNKQLLRDYETQVLVKYN
ncbi:adenine phosphoribosyltransferase [Maribellus sp. YY47]|uniref:adenine phosphoribosyltransferase n=1 Tax=Maribellus sp. YY47 TaxID=2929486 RepID=UPI0020017924|nr:adenine phosphoribosyltransferase [Maribellus sp. YY47]MCK3686131.1 adenine phosphoribosyltransferase [Maribellus sp. YY47]